MIAIQTLRAMGIQPWLLRIPSPTVAPVSQDTSELEIWNKL